MHLEYPLVLLVVLALVVVGRRWLVRLERDRAGALERFGDPAVLGRGSPVLEPVRLRYRNRLRLGLLTLGVLALARPQWGEKPAALDQAGRDVLVLLDLSRSMLVSDVGVSRLEAARQAVTEVLARSPGSRVGLAIFGGSAFLQLPLTTDRTAFARYLAAAHPDALGDPSTDIATALGLAAKTFEHAGEQGYRTVLLVSDGESDGDVGQAARQLGKAGIPVLVVGVGTLGGGAVPADTTEAPEQWHRDHIGRIAMSRLEEETLREVARLTDGAYVRWSSASGAAPVGDALVALRARQMEGGAVTERADRFQWPLGVMLLGFLLEPALLRRRRAP